MGRKIICLIACLLLSCVLCIQGFCSGNYEYISTYSEGLAVAGKYVDGIVRYGYIDEAGNEVTDFIYENAWAFSDSLAKVTVDGHTYFIDKSGEVVLDVSLYSIVSSFEGGVARFCPAEGGDACWGLLNKDGEVVVEAKYSELRPGSEGYFPAHLGGKWGIIDTQGNTVIDFIYEDLNGFSEGLCGAKKDGLWGFIDKDGNTYIEFIFDDAENFEDSVCPVKYRGKWGLMHKDRVYVANPQYVFLMKMENSYYRVSNEEGKFGCVDNGGNVKIDFNYDMIFPSDGEYIKVMNIAEDGEQLYGYVDIFGQRRLPVIYEQAGEIADGRVRVVLNGKTGYVDLKNQPIISTVYQELTALEKGLFLAKKDGLYGIVRDDGSIQAEIKYENPLKFASNGLSAACIEDKWGFIDKDGNAVIDFMYESCGAFDDAGYAIVEKDGLYGIVDSKNNVSASIVYKYLEKTDENLYIAMYGSKYGVINRDGDALYEFVYEDITDFNGKIAVGLRDGLWRILNHPYMEPETASLSFYYYNEPIEFSVWPVNMDGKWMYPLREFCDFFGIQISWNAELCRAEAVKYDFEFSPEGEIVTHTEEYSFDVAAKTGLKADGSAFSQDCCFEKDGTTFVSDEVMAELFDLHVSFDYFSGAYILTH